MAILLQANSISWVTALVLKMTRFFLDRKPWLKI